MFSLGQSFWRNQGSAPVLDLISTSATAAYSTRKLRAAYTGAALRVRRSSDSAELDIGFATAIQTRTNLTPVPINNASGFPVAGITMTTIGTGTEFNLPYVEVRYAGTATAAGSMVFSHSASGVFNPATQAPVTPGVTYTASMGYRLVAGAAHAGTTQLRHTWRNSAGTFVNQTTITVPAATAQMQRFAAIGPAPAGASYSQPAMVFLVALNEVVDFTIRFYAANIEEGIGNARPLLQRNVPEVIANIGDLGVEALLSFVDGNSGFGVTWYDQSGNAFNQSQATAANQPSTNNLGAIHTVNGRPSVQTGGTQFIQADFGLGTIAQPFTRSYVITRLDNAAFGSNAHYIGNFNSTPNTTEYGVSATTMNMYSGGTPHAQTVQPFVLNETGVFTAVYNNSIGNTLTKNNVTLTAPPNVPSANNGLNGARIGAIAGGTTGLFGVSESIVWTSALSVSEIQTLQRNQGEYFGVAVA